MRPSIMMLMLATTLAACGGHADSDYVGAWTRHYESGADDFTGHQKASVVRDTLTIERNGDGYMLHHKRTLTEDSGKPFNYPEQTEPAVFKDGQLQVAGGLGAYVLDKKSGHLVSPDHQGDYIRSSGSGNS